MERLPVAFVFAFAFAAGVAFDARWLAGVARRFGARVAWAIRFR